MHEGEERRHAGMGLVKLWYWCWCRYPSYLLLLMPVCGPMHYIAWSVHALKQRTCHIPRHPATHRGCIITTCTVHWGPAGPAPYTTHRTDRVFCQRGCAAVSEIRKWARLDLAACPLISIEMPCVSALFTAVHDVIVAAFATSDDLAGPTLPPCRYAGAYTRGGHTRRSCLKVCTCLHEV